MANSSLRREVLESFKKLHRTCCYVFKGDVTTLAKAREEINSYYKKNKSETDEEKIRELLKAAYDVDHEIKTTVLQIEQIEPGKYRANLRPDFFEDETKTNMNDVKKR